MKYVVLSAFVVFIIACGTKKNVTTTAPVTPAANPFSADDVARANTIFPGTTENHLATGKTLYEGNCGTCHGLKKVENFTETQWREINPNMVKKANKYKNANLDAEAEQAILKYVVTMAKK